MSGIRRPGKIAAAALYWRAHGRVDVAERLEEQLVAAGRCKACGRPLSNPASVQHGYGPECLTKVSGTTKTEHRAHP